MAGVRGRIRILGRGGAASGLMTRRLKDLGSKTHFAIHQTISTPQVNEKNIGRSEFY